MANRLKMVQKQLLYELFSKDWSNRKINRATGIHRQTIAQYKAEWQQLHPLESSTVDQQSSALSSDRCDQHVQNVPPNEKQLPTDEAVHFQVPTDVADPDFQVTSKSKAAPYDAVIRDKLEHGQQARSIYQDLVVEQQYQGSYDSVKRYIRKLSNKAPQLYARLETAPGEEAQVDFGEGAPTLKNNRYYKPWLFVMTLSNSRNSYQEVVWKQDVETFLFCHERAFQFFGGVPKIVKIDNLKSGVLQAHLYEPELNPNYLAFSQHYGFVPLPCQVRMPHHKGKVESNIKYVQNNALQGKRFSSLDQQNVYLRFWNKTWASTRIHGTTKQQVNLMFETEQPYLQSLPATSFEFFKIGKRKVNVLDSHIEVAGAYYPIPPHYMGKIVMAHYNSKCVKVYYRHELIQQLSTVAKGRFHPDKRCLPPQKAWQGNQYVTYLFDKCQQIGPYVLKWAQQAELQRQQRAYRSIQGVVALRNKYPDVIINRACQQSLEHEALSYHIVKQIAEHIRFQKDIQLEIHFTQQSDVIRSLDEYQQLLTESDSWKR